jgi:DNA-binding NtrC family response regulator
MQRLKDAIAKVAPIPSPVLIVGESGSGKELVASDLHRLSGRSKEPFVAVNCGALPENLVESELFGHERGAFTGAHATRKGAFESAGKGTLFLDEIGELPLELQPKLLRVVESRELRPLGSDKVRRADLRIIAATNRDLATEVNRGTFRHDLYYRLAVVRIAVPPLRSRLEDVPLLVAHFLRRAFSDRPHLADEILASITDETWGRLLSLPWRGNVRELRNAVERALALGGEDWAADIGAGLGKEANQVMHRAGPPASTTTFQDAKREVLAKFEREYFGELWTACGGNISEIARRSGMERAHVRAYLRRHGLTA